MTPARARKSGGTHKGKKLSASHEGSPLRSTSYIALVRAANVGGTGKLPMATLKSLCLDAGFDAVRTYIASGNVVFRSPLPESAVRTALEQRLGAYAGKPVTAILRTAQQMDEVLNANPFKGAPGNRTVAVFLSQSPPGDIIQRATGRGTEKLALGIREIYVTYDQSMADSKLRFPGLESGTARNMNTVAKLASMALELARTGDTSVS